MKTFLRRIVFSIVAAALMPLAAQSAEISGRILGEGAKPVAHAVVLLLREAPAPAKPAKATRVQTGDDGGFVATGLTGGLFRIRVEAPGYAPLTQPAIPASAVVQLRLRPGVKLSGIVRDREAKTPIVGATILAWDKDAEDFGEEAYRTTKSGKDGRFVLSDLLAGKATVEARASGRATAQSRNVPIPKAGFEIFLELPGVLTGVVTTTLGDPVAGADVKVTWRDATGPSSRGVKTGADGRYRIADVWSLQVTRTTVRAAKFLPIERDGPPAEDGVLDFVLERGGSIAGIVLGHDGKFPPSFRVKVQGESTSSVRVKSEHEFTDPAGAFRVDELDPGTYTIEVGTDRYASATKAELVVVAEQVADAGTLTLPSRSVLRGRVVAARDRAPVSGATVRVALVEGPGQPAVAGAKTSWTETTASEGTFATKELPAGTFEVAVEHPQFARATTRVSFQPDRDTPELTLELARGGTLTGTVLNGKLDPVPGVRIVVALAAAGDSRIADTGSDGRYFIDGLAPGSYTVTRESERRQSAASDRKIANITEGETTTVDFDERPSVLVSGMVMRGDAPIPSAGIHFVPMDVPALRKGVSTQSNEDGRYQIGLHHGGRYQVSVVFAVNGGSNTHNVVTLTIPDQPEVRQNIVFNVQSISGRVVDPEGRGVKGVLVTATPDRAANAGSARQSIAMTTDGGVFSLEAIEPATYRVTARARGYGQGELYPVNVGQDYAAVSDLELGLTRGWLMRGRLVDPQGQGVPGALVVVAPRGTAESGYLPAQTDGTGRFRVTAPADAPVSVAAISPRFAPAVQNDVEQPANEDGFEVVLQASEGGTLRVRVVRQGGGGPVPGAQVAFRPVPLFPGCDVVMERNRPKSTDADGATIVTRLYPGTYFVSIVGRRDSPAVQVGVEDGAESNVVIEVP